MKIEGHMAYFTDAESEIFGGVQQEFVARVDCGEALDNHMQRMVELDYEDHVAQYDMAAQKQVEREYVRMGKQFPLLLAVSTEILMFETVLWLNAGPGRGSRTRCQYIESEIEKNRNLRSDRKD